MPLEASVVIPVKTLDTAKSRLSRALNSTNRRQFVLSMLKHVIDTVLRCRSIRMVSVLTADSEIQRFAETLGIDAIKEQFHDLNRALNCATTLIENRMGSMPLLILPSDVPLVACTSIEKMITLADTIGPPVVIAVPSRDLGTNAFLRYPPTIIACAFGPNSFESHRALAQQGHIRFEEFRTPDLELDIDTPEDLAELIGRGYNGWSPHIISERDYR